MSSGDIVELLKSGRPILLTNEMLHGIFHGRPRQRLLNMAEAGEYLGVSRWTVQLLIRKNLFPFISFGKKTKYIDVRDLDKWIDGAKRLASEYSRRGP